MTMTCRQRPRGNLSVGRALPTTTTEVIRREPQQMATGANSAPTPTHHSRANPGGGAWNKSWLPQAQDRHQLDRPNTTRTERSPQKTEDSMNTSTASSSLPFLAWRFGDLYFYARGTIRDICLTCPAKNKRGWRRRARDWPRRRPRLRSSISVSVALCDIHAALFCFILFLYAYQCYYTFMTVLGTVVLF